MDSYRDGSDPYEFGLSRNGEITLNIGRIKKLMSKKPFKNGSSESSERKNLMGVMIGTGE